MQRGLRRVSPEGQGIFEGNFRGFDLFGWEGLDGQARLDPFFGGFLLGEVFVGSVMVAGEVEGVVANRRVVVGGQLSVGVAVVLATVGNFPAVVVIPVSKRDPEHVIDNKVSHNYILKVS